MLINYDGGVSDKLESMERYWARTRLRIADLYNHTYVLFWLYVGKAWFVYTVYAARLSGQDV